MGLVKSESQALTKANDGELSILDAMENLVKAGGGLSHLSHLSHGLLSNYFVPPRSEFLTHSAAQGTVAQSARKSLGSCRKIDMISKMRWAALYACLLYSFCVSPGLHPG